MAKKKKKSILQRLKDNPERMKYLIAGLYDLHGAVTGRYNQPRNPDGTVQRDSKGDVVKPPTTMMKKLTEGTRR